MWEFPKIWGTLFWGPYNKDPTIQGTVLGSLFSETPMYALRVLGSYYIYWPLPFTCRILLDVGSSRTLKFKPSSKSPINGCKFWIVYSIKRYPKP